MNRLILMFMASLVVVSMIDVWFERRIQHAQARWAKYEPPIVPFDGRVPR